MDYYSKFTEKRIIVSQYNVTNPIINCCGTKVEYHAFFCRKSLYIAKFM